MAFHNYGDTVTPSSYGDTSSSYGDTPVFTELRRHELRRRARLSWKILETHRSARRDCVPRIARAVPQAAPSPVIQRGDGNSRRPRAADRRRTLGASINSIAIEARGLEARAGRRASAREALSRSPRSPAGGGRRGPEPRRAASQLFALMPLISRHAQWNPLSPPSRPLRVRGARPGRAAMDGIPRESSGPNPPRRRPASPRRRTPRPAAPCAAGRSPTKAYDQSAKGTRLSRSALHEAYCRAKTAPSGSGAWGEADVREGVRRFRRMGASAPGSTRPNTRRCTRSR